MQSTLSRVQRLLKLFRSNPSSKTQSKNLSSSTTTTSTARPTMSGKHFAAAVEAPGQPLSIIERETKEPGPNEILVEAKAIAVNPLDWFQRDFGMMLNAFPAVVGSDVTGVVAKVGKDVKNAPAVGSRVISFSTAFFNASPDHGAFQKYSLVPESNVIPLPEKLSYEEGAVFPLAVYTSIAGWYTIGVDYENGVNPAEKEAVLVWGGSTSVGTLAIQSGKKFGYTVYTTAGAKNLDYVKSLGASAAFDHKDADVVQKIIAQAKADGVKLRTAHVYADGALQNVLDVLKETKGALPAKVAHAPMLPDPCPQLDNTEIKFTWPPTDPAEQQKFFHYLFQTFLKQGLADGSVVPSPRVQKVEGGLEAVTKALDILKGGVSGTKVVVTGV